VTPAAAPAIATGRLVSVDPATLAPLGEVEVATDAGVRAAVEEAREAQRAWAATSAAVRARVLADTAKTLANRAREIALLCTHESGKPLVESLSGEVFASLEALRWLVRSGPRILADEPLRAALWQPELWLKRGRVRYDPVGVVGIIGPWNFPLAIPLTQAAFALAAGNGVVLKPAGQTPLVGAVVAELFADGGAPPGLVQVVQGGAEMGEALVHSGCDKLFFTGATATGRRVAAAAAEHLLPTVLELGGKDPMLVLDDADLDRAVDGVLWASFLNAGQVCAAVERVYVAEPLYEGFVERLAARASSLRLGRGDDPATDMGPLIDADRLRFVEAAVEAARSGGAQVVAGGEPVDVGLPGHFFAPTVLAGAPAPDDDEVFGPVVSVAPAADDEEALALAEAGPYALGASVWTRDAARGEALARRLRAGSVWINDHAYSYARPQAPWGGAGASGHGRTHSRHGLYECTHIRYLERDAGRLRDPWWRPYGPRSVEFMETTIEALHGPGLARRARAVWAGRGALLDAVEKARGRG
jgi:succinate-semialdehyde dehydrogenase/glutarate-semialdehyde dehydrogenase